MKFVADLHRLAFRDRLKTNLLTLVGEFQLRPHETRQRHLGHVRFDREPRLVACLGCGADAAAQKQSNLFISRRRVQSELCRD